MVLVATLGLVLGQVVPASATATVPMHPGGAAAAAAAAAPDGAADVAFGDLPLTFVENRGQLDAQVRYHAESADHAFFFTPDRVVMSLTDGVDDGVVLALRFLGADPDVVPAGRGPTGAHVSYVRGADPGRWQTELPTFSGVVYPDLWQGVDMLFHATDGELKYEFVVRPGARVEDIRLGYAGADGLRLSPSGALLIDTPAGVLTDSAPVSYQDVGSSRVPVDTRVVLGGDGEYGFAVGPHDPRQTLVIDPALQYSTFLGGTSLDRAHDMAVTAGGEVVVVGVTQSADFPTTVGAVDGTVNGVMDAFVARLSADGSRLVYATYLGGSPTPDRRGATDPTELARAVALDGSGNAYVVGQTSAGDFPTTSGAFQPALRVGDNQAMDAFVTKLGPGGGLVWSTFLGGELGSDDARSVAVDAAGSAYVGGSTFASDFPTTPGAFDRVQHGGEDVYVAKLDGTGSSLVYSTILGGADNELPDGIAVGADGSAYVSGSTRSVDFPSTAGAFQPTHSGGGFADLFEVFVTKLAPDGSRLAYSTFLGGTRVDRGGRLAVDPAGNAHVLIGTLSPEFPVTAGAYDPVFTPTSESGVVKLDATGSRLVYSTFLDGGSAASITLDGDGNAWLGGGRTAGAPVVGGQQNCGSGDVWLAQLDSTGSSLLFASYLGGTDNDGATGIDRDSAGNVYLAGTTLSADFPTTAGAFDRTWAGDTSIFWGDAFVLKLAPGDGPVGPGCPAPVLTSLAVSPTGVPGGDGATGTVTLGAAAPEGGLVVTLGSSSPAATVPATVTVPAGASSATFPVSTSPVGTDTSVTLSAALGDVTRTATLTVRAPAPTVSVSALALDPTSVVGGTSSTGTVTLTGAAPTGGATVPLTSSNTAVATVPADVLVPAGSTSATFTVSTLPQEFDASSAISATYGGVMRSVILSVTPGSSTTTTELAGRADRGRTVSHVLAVGTGTVSMTLSWDESRADLDLLVRDAAGDPVFADTGGSRPTTGSFTVTTAGDHRFEITNTSRRGTSYTLSVTHPPVSSTPEPSDTTSPTVGIASPTGGSTVSGTVTLAASASDDVGVSEVRFFVAGTRIATDTSQPYSTSWDTTTVADGDHVLTAQAVDTSGNSRTSAAVTVTVVNAAPAPAVSLSSVTLSPTTVAGGQSSTGTVTLSAAPSADTSVSLASNASGVATVPASVVVPAGATSATFTASTGTVTADSTATISATHEGTTRSATLTVTAPEPSTTLTAPTLLSPADEARWEPGQSRLFDWSDVGGAATCTLQVSTSSAFTSIQLERTVSASEVSLSFSSEGERYWRVRANDGADTAGPWSATRAFRIKS